MPKVIRIKFTDFPPGTSPTRSFLYQWLSEREEYQVELVDQDPDYLIFSSFGEEHLRYNRSVKIFWTGENQVPDFNFCDYALGFHHLQLEDRYMRYPLYYCYREAYPRMLTKHLDVGNKLKKKTRFCTFVCSNGRGSENRVRFFEALNARKPVDSGGKLLNNVGGPVADKLAFQSEARFSMAFENTCQSGYTTEKIVESFASCTIPIYYGDPRIAEEFNPAAFVNCNDYAGFDEVIDRVLEIENDPEQLRAMLEAPALSDAELPSRTQAELNRFLKHIFDQDKEAAKRYSRDYWAQRMLAERLRQYRAYTHTWYFRLSALYMKYIYLPSRKHPTWWKVTQFLQKKLQPSSK